MDKPKIIGSSNKPKIINPVQAQAIKDITPVENNPKEPFQIEGDLKRKIEEDQKKRKSGFVNWLKKIIKI
jgi:hypothetical protein